MKRFASLLTALLATVAVASAAGPKPGAAAPDFTLPDTNGKEHSLSDFKGKFVVLEWTNFGCPFVKKHYDSKNMQHLQAKYTDKDVVWLMIGSSAEGKQGNFPAEKWNEMIEEKGAKPTAVLLDPEGTVGRLYGATTTPDMYIVDPDGKLLYRGAIDSKPTADKSDIPTSTNYVSAALDAAMEGKPVKKPSTSPYGCSVKYK
jgi:peroxiredoxin